MAIPRFRPSLSLKEALGFFRSRLPLVGTSPGEFERRFGQRLLQGQQVTLAPSGRVALYWLLRALELKRGDEVITQAFNFPAVPAAIQAAGAEPRFVDLAPDTFEPDPAHLEEVIGPRTRAVVITHLYGNPADLATLRQVCDRHQVPFIEDCAQAIGATYEGRPVGTFGLGALFTFGVTKNFTLLAGGAAASADPEVASRVADLARQHPRVGAARSLYLAAHSTGLSVVTRPGPFSLGLFPALRLMESVGLDPVHKIMGEPLMPLTDIPQAPRPSASMTAVGLVQLSRYEALNRARTRNGWYLRRLLRGMGGFTLCPMREGSVFVSFPLFHHRREELASQLTRRGVDTDLGFMSDCSSLEMFADTGGPCPHAQRAAEQILHLPIYPQLTKGDLDQVAEALRGALRATGATGGLLDRSPRRSGELR